MAQPLLQCYNLASVPTPPSQAAEGDIAASQEPISLTNRLLSIEEVFTRRQSVQGSHFKHLFIVTSLLDSLESEATTKMQIWSLDTQIHEINLNHHFCASQSYPDALNVLTFWIYLLVVQMRVFTGFGEPCKFQAASQRWESLSSINSVPKILCPGNGLAKGKSRVWK